MAKSPIEGIFDEFKKMAIFGHCQHTGQSTEKTEFDELMTCTYGFCRERIRMHVALVGVFSLFDVLPDRGLHGLKIVIEVCRERARQDEKHGGPAHDDTHTLNDWRRYITVRLPTVHYVPNKENRKDLIEIAALAVAAVESLDRKHTREIFSV